MLSFVPTVNGNDVRMLLQVSLYSDASGSNARNNQVVKYSDIPYHKLYTYEFTVTKDRPYLQLYLESSAQNNQTTLPWIVKLQNVRLLKIKESESLIKQTVDNIELKVKNTGINIEDGTITLNADKTNVNGNLHIKGQIRKGIINIGQFNLSNYIKVEDSTNFLQLEKTGGLIIFDGYFFTDIGICLVPSLYPEQYNLSEYIHFLGYQVNPYKYLKNMKCLVSMSKQEGFPGVYVEALSLNVPFVSTDVGGAEELSQNGKFGKIIYDDEQAIKEIIGYVKKTQGCDEEVTEFLKELSLEKQIQEFKKLLED